MILYLLYHPLVTLILAGLGWAIWYFVIRIYILRKNMPPGPVPLPFVGNLLMFKGTTAPFGETVYQLSKKYGDPITLWLGKSPALFLHRTETIREALIDNPHDFQSRPGGLFVDQFLNGSQDIIFAPYNDLWHAHKKIASRALRDIVESTKLEWQVNETVDEAVKLMLDKKEPFEFDQYALNIILNILMTFCYGQRLSFDDPIFEDRIRMREEIQAESAAAFMLEAVPGIRYMRTIVETIYPPCRKFARLNNEQIKFVEERVVQHKKDFKPNSEINDILEALFQEQYEMQQRGDAGEKMTDNHVMLLILDVFEAGTETTQNTLQWFFLFMILYPDIQEKCYNDIIEVIDDRLPALNDRRALPFVEACILETLRIRPTVPLGVATTPSLPNAKLGKYTIPEDTMVMTNLFGLHFDEAYWSNPHVFDPTRFIEDGTVMKPPCWLPFGCGKRVCLGETLAKNDLFLITTGLLQKMKFSKVKGEAYTDNPRSDNDFALIPHKYNVLVEAR